MRNSKNSKTETTKKTTIQTKDRGAVEKRETAKPAPAGRKARNTQQASSAKAAQTGSASARRRAVKSRENTAETKSARRQSAAVKTKQQAAVQTAAKADAVKKAKGKIRIIPLGGLEEIGKNMTVVEYGDDIIVIDCGVAFPSEDMPGIDLVIPDITYLEENAGRIRGLFITHGHEDHIGAVPYVLRSLRMPVYGTALTLGIIKNKLEEHGLASSADLRTVKAGDIVQAGQMSVEFIRVNHSIADACCLAIRTPLGTLVHTGDFKLDLTPIEGDVMNITRLGEIGREGVLLLMCESTNAERPGYTPSERKVGDSLEYIFRANEDKRIVVATFSSNVHRVQQVINVSVRHGRHVAVSGRSMTNVLKAATELGYMNIPADALIDITDMKRYKPEQLTLVTTGSQGEPMSALYRMAYSEHSPVQLGPDDVVVLSASTIPGNEKTIGRIINELSKNGVHVLNDNTVEVHVSGHACQEELKLMQALTKPKYFMPVHGEFRQLAANRELARSMGMEDRNIFVSEIGKVLEIDARQARFNGTVPSGVVLIDGSGVGDVGNVVLRDRLHLAQDGMVIVVAVVSSDTDELIAPLEIITRGFIYVKESEELMEAARKVAADTLEKGLSSKRRVDRVQLKNSIRDELSRFVLQKTKRRPMIIPVITYI